MNRLLNILLLVTGLTPTIAGAAVTQFVEPLHSHRRCKTGS